jgi:hypothetical protein
MDRETLEQLIEQGHSLRTLARETGKSQGSVRYWLRTYGLVTQRSPFERAQRRCKCGETDPAKFYGHKTTVCAKCHSKQTLESGRDKKQRARDLLGGKCCYCGYDTFQVALDIHHLDPEKKDPDFHGMRSWSWKRIVKELEGCCLLCRNCHAALHAGLITLNKK